VAPAKVETPFDDNDKKSTAVYREKLYEEITKQKAKLNKSGSQHDLIRTSSNGVRVV
jgi:sRNA-binding carbon storage regulator CsrA